MSAVLSTIGILQEGPEFEPPSAPIDPLALEVGESASTLAYETAAIAAVAEPALDLIRYPWRSELQGWTIVFLEPRGRASGYTWSAEQRIEVFVKDSDTSARVARVLAHELGHAIDVTLNRPDDRREWLAERELGADTPWWPGSGLPDFESGAGDFAEVFAVTQVGSADFRSELNIKIDEGDIELMAHLSLRR